MRHMTIAEIRNFLDACSGLNEEQQEALTNDNRIGVRRAYEKWQKQQEALIERRSKYENMLSYERALWERGIHSVVGVDEVGRGPLAGPVVAGAVVINSDMRLYGINDSKQLSAKQRAYYVQKIKQEAVAYGIGIASPEEIDTINIYQASLKAMMRAIEKLDHSPGHLLVDAVKLPLKAPQTSLIKGDSRSISIAAASILAKETRDNMMRELDQRYPEYGFSAHMGYPTRQHMAALKTHGTTPIHRRSFTPVKEME